MLSMIPRLELISHRVDRRANWKKAFHLNSNSNTFSAKEDIEIQLRI